jgi:hypothetical protein
MGEEPICLPRGLNEKQSWRINLFEVWAGQLSLHGEEEARG